MWGAALRAIAGFAHYVCVCVCHRGCVWCRFKKLLSRIPMKHFGALCSICCISNRFVQKNTGSLYKSSIKSPISFKPSPSSHKKDYRIECDGLELANECIPTWYCKFMTLNTWQWRISSPSPLKKAPTFICNVSPPREPQKSNKPPNVVYFGLIFNIVLLLLG